MYTARLLENTDHGKDHWNSQRVGVFRGETQVGEFARNYSSFGVETFAPFERDGEWYALYSRSYVALSVMRLPSCEHLGGEDEEDGFGFCPGEVWIPRYKIWEIKAKTEEELPRYPKQNHCWLRETRFEKLYEVEHWEDDSNPGDEFYTHPEIHYERFAFLAGFVWGDGPFWKIECRDISRAHEGVIKPISEDWGYYRMPEKLRLRDAVRLCGFDYYRDSERCSVNVEIATMKTVRFNHTLTGEFENKIIKFS